MFYCVCVAGWGLTDSDHQTGTPFLQTVNVIFELINEWPLSSNYNTTIAATHNWSEQLSGSLPSATRTHTNMCWRRNWQRFSRTTRISYSIFVLFFYVCLFIDSCNGDSGGPLVGHSTGQDKLANHLLKQYIYSNFNLHRWKQWTAQQVRDIFCWASFPLVPKNAAKVQRPVSIQIFLSTPTGFAIIFFNRLNILIKIHEVYSYTYNVFNTGLMESTRNASVNIYAFSIWKFQLICRTSYSKLLVLNVVILIQKSYFALTFWKRFSLEYFLSTSRNANVTDVKNWIGCRAQCSLIHRSGWIIFLFSRKKNYFVIASFFSL